MNHFHKLWVDANRPAGHKSKNNFVPIEVSWRDVPITPKGMLALLQGMGRGDLVPNFLIENVKEEETNCQKI